MTFPRLARAWLGGRRRTTAAVLFLAAVAVVVDVSMLWRGVPVSPDMLYLLYPMYALTGRELAAGSLPGWNPFQMAGTPLLANPQSGWGTFPAMPAFTLLPLEAAALVTCVLSLALAAIGTFLFLRSTGVGISAATLGGLAYGMGGQAFTSQFNLTILGLHAWLPWILFGIDAATRTTGHRRLASWFVAGIGASQVVAAWLGQGVYYALIAASAYLAFLTMAGPQAAGTTLRARLRALLTHSAALSVISFGLSAWTLLPRLEFIVHSTLQGGYGAGEQQFAGGLAPAAALDLFAPTRHLGAAPVMVLLGGLLLAKDRTRRFYAVMAIATYLLALTWLVVAGQESEIARTLFGVVPGLSQLHLHFPERILALPAFFASVLAASSLDPLLRADGRSRYVVIVAVAGIFLVSAMSRGMRLPPTIVPLIVALLAACAVVVLRWARRLSVEAARRALVVFTATELVVGGALSRDVSLGDPRRYFESERTHASVALLQTASPPGRFLGYDPRQLRAYRIGYRHGRARRWSTRLLTTSQASYYRLPDIQGYDPVHLRAFEAVLDAANGRPQRNYRNAYVMPTGLASPLLDMLGLRYVLAPEGQRLPTGFVPTSSTDGVVLHTNLHSLPRAWILHDVIRAEDGDALRMIGAGSVDPRRTAIVSMPTPPLQPVMGPERVTVDRYHPNEIRLTADVSATALVVSSEIDYPGWRASVDGVPAPSVRTHGVLRGVVVPPGRHTITWAYASTAAFVGLLVSVGTIASLLALLWHRGRRRPGVP